MHKGRSCLVCTVGIKHKTVNQSRILTETIVMAFKYVVNIRKLIYCLIYATIISCVNVCEQPVIILMESIS